MTLLLVATGDTIAHRAAAVATGRELLELAGPPPERVVVEDVLAEPSWDTSVATQLALARRGPQAPGGPAVTSVATQLALARRVRKALVADEFTGVVVTHGVDTLEETAFLADLVAGPARGGIVFTGAVRPLSEPDPDGPANLAAALRAAADPAL